MTAASAATAAPHARLGGHLGPSIGRGLVFFALGYVLGALVVSGIRLATGNPIETEPIIVGGYPFALIAWLMGVGMWEYWGREWIGHDVAIPQAQGWRRYVHFTLDLSQTTFIDSSGLRSLIELQNRLKENGDGGLVLQAPADPVTRLLRITGLGEHFAVT